MKKTILTAAFLTTIMFAQGYYSGYIYPSQMVSSSDGKEIALPFRLAELKLGFSKGDFDIKLTSALEYRWSTAKSEAELRELYVVWYPSFGEISVGKQILTWGAVDGNNPTDNLNAYNYYYMFMTGTDRKVGSLSAMVNYYVGDWKLTGVIIGEHVPNKLPFNEPDFPLELPPTPNHYISVGDPIEYGLKVQTIVGESDISLSWLKGHDRSFSMANPVSYTVGYRRTSILGADIVMFLGDLTFRGEAAYFFTKTDFETPFTINAEYSQYAVQCEYTTSSDITLNAQLIGNQYFWFSGSTIDPESGFVPVIENNFQMGMGMPFAVITDSGLLMSASGNLFDSRLELKGMTFQNLDGKGMMLGGEVNYSPVENWILHVALNQFIGADTQPDNVFTKLEDFSHVRVGMEYNF